MRLNKFFDTPGQQIFSICGCGGKTSLIWTLAAQSSNLKTLVTTTTNMQNPEQAANLFDYFFDEPETLNLHPRKGITLAGRRKPSGASISSLSLPALEKITPLFDKTFIEADGSRSKPLKAWADYEPVITESTSITIGILPVWPVGEPASDTIIHRLPLFTTLSGAREGETITLEHYIPIISGQTADGADKNSSLCHSLFSLAKGKKILFFNQIEDEYSMENARRITNMLPQSFRNELSAVIAGSVRNDSVTIL
ncbi:MAG: putative selenium-dependent hydroxylase accessory protein YqeC [Spirochaetaceae bacterium]|jgi:probable selenium-dependent hydroxylase accessory protein YqeC|nr:putative selenium-dependent hydroxylase accessory protein YqeC [Spirochaetaceae bacterium]